MMRSVTTAMAALAMLALVFPACAASTSPALRDTAFLTCAEAQAMPVEQRKALVLDIADVAAQHYQTQIANSKQVGEQIGWLIRSACTMAPEAYVSTVVARAVRVMGGGIEPPLQQPLDMNQAVFVSCTGASALPPEQLKQVGSYIGAQAAAHYHLTPGPDWTPDYVAALVHNGCKMYPDSYYLGIIGRAIRAVSVRTEPPAASIRKDK